MPTIQRLFFAILFVLALVACGRGAGSGPSDSDSGAAVDAAGVTATGSLDEKPTISIPEGDPPAELVTADVVVGDGEEAKPESTVTAHYVGQSWSSGEEFDASWNSGQPIPFPLNGVIPGWTQGIPGMKVGGRRILVIPPDLAYGEAPPPGSGIEPGETLVFVVDLVDVE